MGQELGLAAFRRKPFVLSPGRAQASGWVTGGPAAALTCSPAGAYAKNDIRVIVLEGPSRPRSGEGKARRRRWDRSRATPWQNPATAKGVRHLAPLASSTRCPGRVPLRCRVWSRLNRGEHILQAAAHRSRRIVPARRLSGRCGRSNVSRSRTTGGRAGRIRHRVTRAANARGVQRHKKLQRRPDKPSPTPSSCPVVAILAPIVLLQLHPGRRDRRT